MPSEYSPGGWRPRMTNAQIRKLQRDQKIARQLAEEKIAAAKNSDEWKKEKEALLKLEENFELPPVFENDPFDETDTKERTLWGKIVEWFKKTFS